MKQGPVELYPRRITSFQVARQHSRARKSSSKVRDRRLFGVNMHVSTISHYTFEVNSGLLTETWWKTMYEFSL